MVSRETKKGQIKNSEEKSETEKDRKTYNRLSHEPLDSDFTMLTSSKLYRPLENHNNLYGECYIEAIWKMNHNAEPSLDTPSANREKRSYKGFL